MTFNEVQTPGYVYSTTITHVGIDLYTFFMSVAANPAFTVKWGEKQRGLCSLIFCELNTGFEYTVIRRENKWIINSVSDLLVRLLRHALVENVDDLDLTKHWWTTEGELAETYRLIALGLVAEFYKGERIEAYYHENLLIKASGSVLPQPSYLLVRSPDIVKDKMF